MEFFFGVFTLINIKAIAISFLFVAFCYIIAHLFLLSQIFEGRELVLLDGEGEQMDEWIWAKEASIRNLDAKDDIKKGDDSLSTDST